MRVPNTKDESFGGIILIIDVRTDKLFEEVYPPLHRETHPIPWHGTQCLLRLFELVTREYF